MRTQGTKTSASAGKPKTSDELQEGGASRMPRGVYKDRSSFPNMLSMRIITSRGEVEGQVIMSERAAASLAPSAWDEMLWDILDRIDPDTMPAVQPQALSLLK